MSAQAGTMQGYVGDLVGLVRSSRQGQGKWSLFSRRRGVSENARGRLALPKPFEAGERRAPSSAPGQRRGGPSVKPADESDFRDF
jgi:hypothetical protein